MRFAGSFCVFWEENTKKSWAWTRNKKCLRLGQAQDKTISIKKFRVQLGEGKTMVGLQQSLMEIAPRRGKLAVLAGFCQKNRISISTRSFGCADKGCEHVECPWHPESNERVAVNC